MRVKKRLLYAVIAGLNAVSLTAALALTIAGSSIARTQSYNRAAQKWDRDGESSQISCYFSDDAGFTTDGVYALRAHLNKTLQDAVSRPDGKTPEIPDAYSTPIGSDLITSDNTGQGEAELTAVGGEFFLFRDFRLLSGAYFSDRDLMQDGAVIERSLAWTLYGSANVAGQNIYIGGVQFYIAAVIDDPTDKYQKRTINELPRVYVSYKGAEQLPSARYSSQEQGYGGYTGGDAPAQLRKVSCYECIMYDPVENFAYSTVNKYLKDMYKGKYKTVNNTKRFTSSAMVKAYKKRSDYAVRKDTITYPYWENASRIAEFKISPLYYIRRICFVIPALTSVWLLWVLFRLAKKGGKTLISTISDKYTKAAYSRRQKKDNI